MQWRQWRDAVVFSAPKGFLLQGIFSYNCTRNKKYSYFWNLLSFPPTLMWGGIAELDLWLRAHAEVTQLMAGDTAEDKGSVQTHTFLSLCFTSEIFYQVKQTFNSRNNIKNYSLRVLLPLQKSSKLPASQIKCAPQILMFNIYLARALCSFYHSGKLVTVGWKEKHLKSLTALIYP